MLQSFAEDLEGYDQGLRRYPVVFYFRTRRAERSIPRVFAALGDLIELTRWGLPAGQPLTTNPYLLALADEYTTAVRRLQRGFVGPPHDQEPVALPEQAFWKQYDDAHPADPLVAAFQALGKEARQASGLDGNCCHRQDGTYQRYRD